jgi:hypothetical protein
MAVATTTAVVAGGIAIGTATAKYLSDRAKRKADQKAAKQAQEAAEKQRQELITSADANATRVGEAYDRAKQDLIDYTGKAKEAYAAGDKAAGDAFKASADAAKQDLVKAAAQAKSDLSGGYAKSRDALSGGYAQARDAGTKGFGQARDALAPLSAMSHYGEDAVTGKGFETSEGYQFRLGQGQQALDRKIAAAGGRLSGASLKAASEYNQGFASNEYGNWASRAAHLGDVGYQATGKISDIYGQEGTFLADNYSREGTGLADIYGREGQGLSDISTREGEGLSGIDMASANWLGDLAERGGVRAGNLESSLGAGLANLGTGSANAQANLRTNAAAQNSNITMAMMPTYGAGSQYAGSGYDALGQGLGTFGQLAAYGMGSGGGSGQGMPQDASMLNNGATSYQLADYYGTPYAPPGYYR